MYFVIRKASNDEYYFVIKSGNGEVVATSETYKTKASAKETIESIKNEINPDTNVIDVA